MYSINTGVLLLTFYSEQLPLKQSTLCIEFKTRVSEQQKKPNKQIDSNSIICPHVFILEHAMWQCVHVSITFYKTSHDNT